MKYRVQVYCPDCTYEDSYGCNDGQPWYVSDSPLDPPTLFTTREAAEDAGAKSVLNSIYRYEIEEVS